MAINKHNLIIIIKVVFKAETDGAVTCCWYSEFHTEIVKVSICASIRLINYKGVISSETINIT